MENSYSLSTTVLPSMSLFCYFLLICFLFLLVCFAFFTVLFLFPLPIAMEVEVPHFYFQWLRHVQSWLCWQKFPQGCVPFHHRPLPWLQEIRVGNHRSTSAMVMRTRTRSASWHFSIHWAGNVTNCYDM